MGKRLEITGKTFGRLTVVRFSHSEGNTFWKCICECGNTKTVAGYKLTTGTTKSCGCLRADTLREIASKDVRLTDDPDYSRNYKLMKTYGISLDDYARMLEEQDGHCKICPATPEEQHHNVLMVDHDHTTGEVRGLLCHHCNAALGHFEDDVDRMLNAIEYLRKTKFGGK